MNIESVASRGNVASAGIGESAPAVRRPAKAESNAPVDNARVSQTANENRQPEQPKLSVQEATERLNKFVSSVRPEINFTVDEASGTRIVRVVDSASKEVIRQIPSEEAIQLAQVLDKLQGLFVKETA